MFLSNENERNYAYCEQMHLQFCYHHQQNNWKLHCWNCLLYHDTQRTWAKLTNQTKICCASNDLVQHVLFMQPKETFVKFGVTGVSEIWMHLAQNSILNYLGVSKINPPDTWPQKLCIFVILEGNNFFGFSKSISRNAWPFVL